MSDVRNYRHGKKHRSGNVTTKKFCEDFGFKSVKFTKGFIGSDKSKVLNNSYDGLMDLSDILGFQPLFMSLLSKEKEGLSLYFSENKKIPNGLMFDSFNQYAMNWFKALDRSIGNYWGFDGGLLKNMSNVNNGDFSELSTLLKTVKYKEVLSNYYDSPEMENALDALYSLLENIPILSQETLEEVASVEDTITIFKRELSTDAFDKMMTAVNEYIEKYGVQLGDLKEQLRVCFENINEVNKNLLYAAPKTIEVETDYIKKLRNFFLDGDDLRILSLIFECYVIEKGKEKDISNNYLHGDVNSKTIVYPSDDEKGPMLEAMHNYLLYVINTYEYDFTVNKAVNEKDNEEIIPDVQDVEDTNIKDEVDENNDLDTLDNIDKVLKTDDGKFKLTLFKELSKEMSLPVDVKNVEYLTDLKLYYIPFKDSNLKAIKVSSFNNPEENGHCINVYSGQSGDTKNGYWWDGTLDYKDLINTLLEYCKGNEKFKLTYFKELCKKNGLKVSFNESLVHVNKNKYRVEFNNSFIKYILVPVYSKDIIDYEIKTIGENVTFYQNDTFDYEELVLELVNIEQNGITKIEKEKEKVEEEMTKVTKLYDATKKEQEAEESNLKTSQNRVKNIIQEISDSKNIYASKDLRRRLTDYVSLGTKRVNYCVTPNSVIECVTNNLLANGKDVYNIKYGTIPEGKGKGCSKSWVIDRKDNSIVIPKSGENRKQIEGIIESNVTLLLKNKTGLPAYEEKMYIESVTFMICKNFGLDVRTYCQDGRFESLIRESKSNTSSFILKSLKLYEKYAGYFVLN